MIIVVSCVISDKDKVLMVQQGKGHLRGLWGLPSGRLESNEGIVQAVHREVEEETGYKVAILGLTGIYNFLSEANTQVMMLSFIGEVVGGAIKFDNNEIINVKWLSVDEISKLKDSELRNHKVNRLIINNLKDKYRIPLEMVNDLIS